jgi:hypothetical protein
MPEAMYRALEDVVGLVVDEGPFMAPRRLVLRVSFAMVGTWWCDRRVESAQGVAIARRAPLACRP